MKSNDHPTLPFRNFPLRHFPAPPRLDSGFPLASCVHCIFAANHLSAPNIRARADFPTHAASVIRFPSLVAPMLFLLPACTINSSGAAE